MGDTHFHELAPKAVNDWDGRRIRDGDVVGTHANDRSVLLVQFTISGWSVAAADHGQAVQARELGQERSW
jgi:archaeosine-15-forming tRNA-guanine transglycosylase